MELSKLFNIKDIQKIFNATTIVSNEINTPAEINEMEKLINLAERASQNKKSKISYSQMKVLKKVKKLIPKRTMKRVIEIIENADEKTEELIVLSSNSLHERMTDQKLFDEKGNSSLLT